MSKELRNIFDQAPPRKIERRRGLDRRGKIGLALSVAGWALWVAGLYISSLAFPQLVTYFDALYGKTPRSWQPDLFYTAELLWTGGTILCVLSLVQFRNRYKRRSDKMHYGILAALVFNALSIVILGVYTFYRGF
ncbi:MAG: hypothetical protein LBU58_06920 [Clostridiales bacterium]|jgi:hypothetical protein|nr:hypothetical protein [Clostridiales bacterium]